ncbi:MAG: deoxyribonuclease IV [Acidimicrobiia bacterium]|nr:deoxyribonuclease IV [Acidimicrobiia bacterium]MDH5294789.1 deoxyribonuclease IV [Acidimicrobiia bacterium]
MLFGAHTPSGSPIREAQARGADLVQIFLSSPQSWKKPAPRDDAEELRQAGLPIYVHAPYLINVVAENTRVRIPSRRILAETCEAAAAIGAEAVIVHGGHLTGDGDIREAYPRWRKALAELDSNVPVLIENTAAGDMAVARRVDGIRALWEEIGDLDTGFVLDTCHAWAGGEPLDEVVERVLAATGRIDLIHCNDSRDPFDSRRDRHAGLGRGQIPIEDIVAVVRKANAPVVIETPGEVDDHRTDLALLRDALC